MCNTHCTAILYTLHVFYKYCAVAVLFFKKYKERRLCLPKIKIYYQDRVIKSVLMAQKQRSMELNRVLQPIYTYKLLISNLTCHLLGKLFK